METSLIDIGPVCRHTAAAFSLTFRAAESSRRSLNLIARGGASTVYREAWQTLENAFPQSSTHRRWTRVALFIKWLRSVHATQAPVPIAGRSVNWSAEPCSLGG